MPSGAFNPDFDPIARPGDAVKLAPERGFHRIRNYNVQPGVTLESDVVVADGAEEKQELLELEMDDGYLLHVRIPQIATELPDDVEIRIDHDGKQSPMYETKNERGVLTNETGSVYGYDPETGDSVLDHVNTKFTELFVWEDNPPYFTFSNSSGGQVSVNLTFVGYVYDLVDVSQSDLSGTPVSVPTKALR